MRMKIVGRVDIPVNLYFCRKDVKKNVICFDMCKRGRIQGHKHDSIYSLGTTCPSTSSMKVQLTQLTAFSTSVESSMRQRAFDHSE